MEFGEILCLVEQDATLAFLFREHPLRAFGKRLSVKESRQRTIESG